MNGNARGGMTLVELLVVLVILASLALSVAVSSSGALDRARTEKARRQGHAMRGALAGADGLDLARDMGRMLDTAQPGELALFASRTFRRDARHRVGEDGPLDPDRPGDLRLAPLFRAYSVAELRSSVTNVSAEAATLNACFAVPAVSNLWSGASVGAGWRGPYCAEAEPDADTCLLLDPFGGFWDFTAEASMRTLVCYGMDRLGDGTSSVDTNDWRNLDIRFPVCPTNDTGELDVVVDFPSDDGAAATNTVTIYCLAPQLHAEDACLESDGVTCRMLPAAFRAVSVPAAASAGGMVTIGGLAPGTWAVFPHAQVGGGHYAAPVRPVTVGRGRSRVRFTLCRLTP